MAKMIEHIAIENGTMSEPYRFIQKGGKVDLTEDQTAFYKGSWLRPTKEGLRILNAPPDFPGIRTSGANGTNAMQFEAGRQMNPASDAYNAQMKTIIDNEKAADGVSTDASSTDEEPKGTGNLDPLA